MSAQVTALALLLALTSPLLAADNEAIRIEAATSPDKTLRLTATGTEAGCVVILTEVASGRTLTKFPVEGLWAWNAGEYFTAVWKGDSSAVALNARCGRSITKCLVVCLAQGKWQSAAFPEDRLTALRKRNNIDDDKAQDYLEAAVWQAPDLLQMTYQGNVGIVNRLTFQLITKTTPHLTLVKETADPN